MHMVITEACPEMAVKLFRIHELPDGFLERTLLSVDEKRMCRAVRSGLTCRAVRGGARGVFNGRVGQPIKSLVSAEEEELLGMAEFPVLQGRPPVTEGPTVSEDATPSEDATEITYWRMKEGDDTTVNQWLVGMGETELVPPEQRPEAPQEAHTLATNRNSTIGRTRVPRSSQPLPLEVQNVDEANTAEPGPTFQQLLQAAAGDRFGPQDSDVETEASRDSDETIVAANISFQSLMSSGQGQSSSALPPDAVLPGGQDGRGRPVLTTVADRTELEYDAASQSTSASTSQQGSTSLRSQHEQLSNQTDPAYAPSTALQSYGKAFAGLDTIGLAADAASQARWDLAHPQTPTKKKKKGRIQLASEQPNSLSSSLSQTTSHPATPRSSSGRASMSVSTGRELPCLQPRPAPELVTGTTYGTAGQYPGTASAAEPGAYRVAQESLPANTLIDDTDSSSDDRTVTSPTGLETPSGLAGEWFTHAGNGAERGKVAGQSTRRTSSGSTQSELLETDAGNNFQPQSYQENQQPIVERLEPLAQNIERSQKDSKKYTMRQKTRKKSKGQKVKVELPLPDPVPPPKKSKQPDASVASPSNAKQGHNASNARLPKAGREEVQVPAGKNSASGSVFSTNNEADSILDVPGDAELLSRFLKTIVSDGARVAVHLGLVFTFSVDKKMRKEVVTAQAMASRLNAAASRAVTFSSRLTTETTDVLHMLNLADGPTAIKVFYEFHVRFAGGTVRIINVELPFTCAGESGRTLVQDLSSVQLLTNIDTQYTRAEMEGEVLAKAYMHYPLRVWDAEVVVKAPAESADALTACLASLSTLGTPPSFTALVPTSEFAVQRVLAKKEYHRTLIPGKPSQLVLTEVQDLVLSPHYAPQANLRASAGSREEMVTHQRLWWEARVETSSDGAEICEAVEKLVTQMDGVGYNNVGPFEHTEKRPEEKVTWKNFW